MLCFHGVWLTGIGFCSGLNIWLSWYMFLIQILLFFMSRVLEALMMRTTGGHHGWILCSKSISLFNASYMLIRTRANVTCIAWIAWMVLSALSALPTTKIIALFRFTFHCQIYWKKTFLSTDIWIWSTFKKKKFLFLFPFLSGNPLKILPLFLSDLNFVVWFLVLITVNNCHLSKFQFFFFKFLCPAFIGSLNWVKQTTHRKMSSFWLIEVRFNPIFSGFSHTVRNPK